MAKEVNKYGLSRNICADIRREVRQRCGFGCVKCGRAWPLDYHHFNPEFSEATEHKASGIALLCRYCHGLRTDGLLSETTLAEYYANPVCLKKGFNHGALDIGRKHFAIVIGSVDVHGAGEILRVHGESVLAIKPPEQESAPFRVDASLYDEDGQPILWITDNIEEPRWQADTKSWDVEVKGRRVTIRQAKRHILFQMRTQPPDALIFENLQMYHRGVTIECKEGKHLRVKLEDGRSFQSSAGTFVNCETAFDITTEGIQVGKNHELAHFDTLTLDNRIRPLGG
jgi:hypothetical protein